MYYCDILCYWADVQWFSLKQLADSTGWSCVHVQHMFSLSSPASSPLQVICIIVKNESDVSAFSNYQPLEQGGGATPPPSEPPQQVRVKSDYADSPATLCLLCDGQGRGGWSTPHATCVIICGLVALRVITCHPITWHYLSPFDTSMVVIIFAAHHLYVIS